MNDTSENIWCAYFDWNFHLMLLVVVNLFTFGFFKIRGKNSLETNKSGTTVSIIIESIDLQDFVNLVSNHIYFLSLAFWNPKWQNGCSLIDEFKILNCYQQFFVSLMDLSIGRKIRSETNEDTKKYLNWSKWLRVYDFSVCISNEIMH